MFVHVSEMDISMHHITAAIEFVSLPTESRRRRGAVSRAPYSPTPGAPPARLRHRRSRLLRPPVAGPASSPPDPAGRRSRRRHTAQRAPIPDRDHRDTFAPRINAARHGFQSALRRSAAPSTFAPVPCANSTISTPMTPLSAARARNAEAAGR